MGAMQKVPSYRVDVRGMTALVTGASSGIGLEIARQLASAGANLILVARRKERLDALAAELVGAHKITADVLALDLGKPGAGTQLFEQTEGQGRRVDILINNAGFGIQDPFVDIPWERTSEQLSLNIVSLTEACHRFGNAMVQRGRGFIMNVASIGAYVPTPFYASYAAGKAYVRNFSEAIASELRPKGVVVSCLCPGPTTTEFTDVAGHAMEAWQKRFFMSASDCAAIGLRGLFAGRPNVVAGVGNNVMMFTLRFVPRRMATWVSGKMMGKKAAA